MKILALVTDAFGGHGGIAKFNRDLLTALCSDPTVESVIALPRLVPETPQELPRKLEFITQGVGGKIRYALAVLRSTFRLSRSPAVSGPVVILCGHINLLPLAFLARFLWRLRSRVPSSRCPLVLVIHGIDAWQPTRSRLVNRLVRGVDAIIAVSEFTQKKFWEWANPQHARHFILPNCVNLLRFTPGAIDSGLLARYGLADRTVLLTVARLSAAERYKGIDEVLEVLGELAKTVPNLAYLIVGEGDDRSRLMAKAQSLGLCVNNAGEELPSPSRAGTGQGEVSNAMSVFHPAAAASADPAPLVVFTGYIPEARKVEHYRLGDVFVMPGWGEGFGIAYLEAMACGVPVVASQLDASQEAVRHGELGVVVNPQETGAILRGIQSALQRSRGVVPRGLDHFSEPAFVARVGQILDGLTPAGSEPQREITHAETVS